MLINGGSYLSRQTKILFIERSFIGKWGTDRKEVAGVLLWALSAFNSYSKNRISKKAGSPCMPSQPHKKTKASSGD